MPREPGANSRREPLTGLSWSGGLPAGRGSTPASGSGHRAVGLGSERWWQGPAVRSLTHLDRGPFCATLGKSFNLSKLRFGDLLVDNAHSPFKG